MRAFVVGAGIFGVTTALALRARGHAVTLVDPGPIPHPLAESTDISKVIRIDYGADLDYTRLGEQALAGWRQWNARWPRPLFHETGVTFLARTPMAPGGFEHDSHALLVARGHPLERLDTAAIARRFPAYRPGALVDGYVSPVGGWAEASAVVAQLADEARLAGVTFATAQVERDAIDAWVAAGDLVVVCAGAWLPLVVPELAGILRATGQPVFHLQPDIAVRPLFAAHHFPVFGADIARTGYYGFPIDRDGIVKIANHGTGTSLAPGAPDRDRVVTAAQEAALRAMLADTFPALATSPIVDRRLCVYGDTPDGDFWIARHPARANLVVAAGGSGHAFKFAPVLGELIATIAHGEPHPLAARFGWRVGAVARTEAARSR